MDNVTEWVRAELKGNVDDKYREFQKSLVPGMENIQGVRLPVIRKIAQRAAKEDYRDFAEHADIAVYEELMIRGMMIGYANLDRKERETELIKVVPLIDNWGVCDSCCTTYKFMKNDQEDWFSFIKNYLYSGREFEIRFAVVCMLDFFINEEFIDRVLKLLSEVHHDGYYVKMAVAWALSVCYVKYPEKTEPILRNNILDDFTQNKTIQKIRESYRVSKEDKERLNHWKRKGRIDKK